MITVAVMYGECLHILHTYIFLIKQEEKMFDVLALGEILLRLSPPMNEKLVRGETFEKQVGGAELNVLSCAALLGLRAGIISKLAHNDIGEFARNRVRFVGGG